MNPTDTIVAAADYAQQLDRLIELNYLIAGFGLFFVIVLLCYFGYKFFKIFF